MASKNETSNYYAILGISRESTDREISSAYRQLALERHPDKNPGNPDAKEEFPAYQRRSSGPV
ncbi:DnaJ domain-containing protein [Xylariales sp. AK1849]|nr:DnaJ domain-containing protein [Xylariales sp. AK1849]